MFKLDHFKPCFHNLLIVQWKLVESFENVTEFKASKVFEDLKDFSIKNKWHAGHAEVESLVCKFSRRANFKKCPRLMKIEYCSTSQAVSVFDNQCDHNHPDIDLRSHFQFYKEEGKVFILLAKQYVGYGGA